MPLNTGLQESEAVSTDTVNLLVARYPQPGQHSCHSKGHVLLPARQSPCRPHSLPYLWINTPLTWIWNLYLGGGGKHISYQRFVFQTEQFSSFLVGIKFQNWTFSLIRAENGQKPRVLFLTFSLWVSLLCNSFGLSDFQRTSVASHHFWTRKHTSYSLLDCELHPVLQLPGKDLPTELDPCLPLDLCFRQSH